MRVSPVIILFILDVTDLLHQRVDGGDLERVLGQGGRLALQSNRGLFAKLLFRRRLCSEARSRFRNNILLSMYAY